MGFLRIPWAENRKWRFFPVPRAWSNAIAWKEFFFTTGGTLGFLGSSLLLTFIIGLGIFISWYDSNIDIVMIGWFILITGLSFFILKCVYMSSTVFNREMEEKTYATLTLLPVSIRKIAYSKILGGSLFIVPSLIAILIGILFATNFLSDVEFDSKWLLTGSLIISGLVQFIFYLYLVTFFSLIIRYGGFVIALLVFILVKICMGIPSLMISLMSFIPFGVFGNYGPEIIFAIDSVISIGIYTFAIIFTNRLIGKKLRDLAAA